MVDRTTLPLLISAVLGAIAAAPIAAQVAGSDSVAGSEIRTSATAERSVRPDRATVTLSFAAAGRTPALAGEAVAARADSLRDADEASRTRSTVRDLSGIREPGSTGVLAPSAGNDGEDEDHEAGLISTLENLARFRE